MNRLLLRVEKLEAKIAPIKNEPLFIWRRFVSPITGPHEYKRVQYNGQLFERLETENEEDFQQRTHAEIVAKNPDISVGLITPLNDNED